MAQVPSKSVRIFKVVVSFATFCFVFPHALQDLSDDESELVGVTPIKSGESPPKRMMGD